MDKSTRSSKFLNSQRRASLPLLKLSICNLLLIADLCYIVERQEFRKYDHKTNNVRFTSKTSCRYLVNGLTWCGNENLSPSDSDGIDYYSCPNRLECDYTRPFWGLASTTVKYNHVLFSQTFLVFFSRTFKVIVSLTLCLKYVVIFINLFVCPAQISSRYLRFSVIT